MHKRSVLGMVFEYRWDFRDSILLTVVSEKDGMVTLNDGLDRETTVPLSTLASWFAIPSFIDVHGGRDMREREPVLDPFAYVGVGMQAGERFTLKHVVFDVKKERVEFELVRYREEEPTYEHFSLPLLWGPRKDFEPALHFKAPEEKPGVKQSRKVTPREAKVDPRVLELMASGNVEELKAYLKGKA